MNSEENKMKRFIAKLTKYSKELEEDFKQLSQENQTRVKNCIKEGSPFLLSSFISFLNE